MVPELIFDPDARLELEHAASYYENVQPGLGKQFLEEVEIATESILRNPTRWRFIKAPFRRCLLKRFPYRMIFTSDEKVIYIVALMHQKRKPEYWLTRVQ